MTKRRRLLYLTGIGLLLISPLLYFWLMPSTEQQLKALDAARAIPDEENAALNYIELTQMTENMMELRHIVECDVDRIRKQPWHASAFPKVADWLETHQPVINKLIMTSKMDNCILPLTPSIQSGSRIHSDPYFNNYYGWKSLLSIAIQYDLGEGRYDAAMEKYQVFFLIGKHFRQQPTMLNVLRGIAIEHFGLGLLSRLVIEDNSTHIDLNRILFMQTTDEAEYLNHYEESLRIDAITERYESLHQNSLYNTQTWWKRILESYRQRKYNETSNTRIKELLDRYLTIRRAFPILVELRRFKNQTGQWPLSLDKIAASLPLYSLIDSYRSKPFVYGRAGTSFYLYSVGPNGIDENGQHGMKAPTGGDDWSLWPLGKDAAYEAQQAN